MNLNKSDRSSTKPTALDALENWLETLHGSGGYYGPVAGLSGTAVTWCGPGNDWRLEGLLDGWVTQHRSTGDSKYTELIKQTFSNLTASQIADGSFRNSCFERNPLEGGMPHEPAVMAAVLKAGAYLTKTGSDWPEGAMEMLERFVEEHLIRTLWNKRLQTFNNWMQSDFESYSPTAVASIIETLYYYGKLTNSEKRWAPYITGAAESILKRQILSGRLAGAIPDSSDKRASASPYLSVRCLPALMLHHSRTGDQRFAEAAELLGDFTTRSFQNSGGLTCMAFSNRPDRISPLYVGATAGALSILDKAGMLDKQIRDAQIQWLLSLQSESGGFDTAVGFGNTLPQKNPPDWRDALPGCGWAPMVYSLLTGGRHQELFSRNDKAGTVQRKVTVRGKTAEMTEDHDSIIIKTSKSPLFIWRKCSVWPELCHL